MNSRIRLLALCFLFLFATACGASSTEDPDEQSESGNDFDLQQSSDRDSDDQQQDDQQQDDDHQETDEQQSGDEDDGQDDGEQNDDTTVDQIQICRTTCETASDCGDEDEWYCEDQRCLAVPSPGGGGEVGPCETDSDCVAERSWWLSRRCDTQEDCEEPDRTCIEHDGEGFCALDADGIDEDCTDMWWDEVDKPLVGEDGDATVCANLRAVCQGSQCDVKCFSDDDCNYPGGDACYDGYCVCSGDEACRDAGYDVCEPPS